MNKSDNAVDSRDEKVSPPAEPDYSVRAVDRVCDILDFLRQAERPVQLGTIAAGVGVPTSTVFRYLWTLNKRGYTEHDSDAAVYSLGLDFPSPELWRLAFLVQRAHPHLERLRDDLDETVNLGVLDRDRVTYLDIVESHRDVRFAAEMGDRHPIHVSALGKIMAASLPIETVRSILENEGMAPETDRTITSVEEYLEELERTRVRGWAIDDRENEPDGRCIAVLLLDRPLSAISLSAPEIRLDMTDVEEVAAALRRTAMSISSELVHESDTSARRHPKESAMTEQVQRSEKGSTSKVR